ncbi:uncharacterized protein LOC135407297 [Pseudopipra pipra]|uniref:uncharacterized protein LOC135407297 n=1 Tax=Pseudopipra pipra TaxID=415032 RepID=UPI0031395C48
MAPWEPPWGLEMTTHPSSSAWWAGIRAPPASPCSSRSDNTHHGCGARREGGNYTHARACGLSVRTWGHTHIPPPPQFPPPRAPRSSQRRCCIPATPEGPERPLRSGSCRGGPAGAPPLLLLALPSPGPAGENTELPPFSTAGGHYSILEDMVPPALSATVIIIVTTVISLIMDLEFCHYYQVFSLGETERTQDLGNCLNLSSFEIVKTNWTHFWNSKGKPLLSIHRNLNDTLHLASYQRSK